MPFRIVERHGEDAWAEIYVDASGPEPGPVEKRIEIDAPGFDIPVGTRAPWHEQAQRWLTDVLDRGAARVLVLDYGAATTAELADRGEWLRTYADHGRGHDAYAAGSFDITTDVGFDQFPVPKVLTSQAAFLAGLHIDELVAEGKEFWQANAARPGLDAFKMRSRVAEAAALCDPAGLGGWQVAIWEGAIADG